MDKVIAIILIVVALGVGLYFITSGGAARLGSVIKFGSASTTISASGSGSSTASGGTGGASAAAPPASSSNPIAAFFQMLFAPHGQITLPTVPGGNGSSGGTSGYGNTGSGGNSNPSGPPNIPADEIPAGLTLAQLSPYFHEIRFNGIGQSEIGLVTSPAYNTPTSTVDITGWEIKTNRGGEFIPQAENIYYPTGVGSENDIILTISDYNTQYVNLFSNSAPVNLRLNECLGYLNDTNQFNPPFSNSCPTPDLSDISQFTGACQNYIESLGGCQTPNFSSYYFPQKDYQCEDYLEGKYNYNWCVSTYATSPNFLGDEWRVWMGSSPLDPYHDTVELLDRNGLVVDTYTY